MAGRMPSSPASRTIWSTCSTRGSTAASCMMQRITWSSPADILERIIRYEAVHMIQGWDDLRRGSSLRTGDATPFFILRWPTNL